MKPNTKSAHNLITEGLQALSNASKYGIKLDVRYCQKMYNNLEKRLIVLEDKVKDSELGKQWQRVFPKINIRSDSQLSTVLYNVLKLPVFKLTKNENPSVDAGTLELLSKDLPSISLINDYKKIYVVNNTFLKGFLREQVDGILHPFFPLHKVKTFRGSSSDPNLQNLPNRDKLQKKLVRKAIRPRKGHQLIEVDYSGIEVRVACCVTGDKKLMYDILHGDMHGDMAVEIFKLDEFKKEGYEKELRFAAKNGFVFAQFYGDYYGNNVPVLLRLAELPVSGEFTDLDGKKLITGETLGTSLINKGIKNVKQFTDHMEEIEYSFWNKRYKDYGAWRKGSIKEYKKKGYLNTVTGFTCKGVMSKNEIVNYPMQGPAFHCLLKSFTEIDKRQNKHKWNSKQIGEIHDATLIDTDPNEKDYVLEELSNVMTKWLPSQWNWITAPLEVEADIYPINGSWGTKAETKII